MGTIRILGALIATVVVPLLALRDRPLREEFDPLPLTIQDGSAVVEGTVPRKTDTVGAALAQLGIDSEHARVVPNEATPLEAGMRITIARERRFTLTDGAEEPREVVTTAQSVAGALEDAGVTLSAYDTVRPEVTTPLTEGLEVVITRITVSTRTETVAIPYDTVVTDDPELPFKQERLVTKGVEGSAEEIVELRVKNSEVVKRTVLERTVLQPPVTEERVRGTKLTIGDVDEGLGVWGDYAGCVCAASHKYPRGTYVRVTNLNNGKQVIVRINDYYDPAVDPYYEPAAPRIIDLDIPAFRQLEQLWKGVIPVRVEQIL